MFPETCPLNSLILLQVGNNLDTVKMLNQVFIIVIILIHVMWPEVLEDATGKTGDAACGVVSTNVGPDPKATLHIYCPSVVSSSVKGS